MQTSPTMTQAGAGPRPVSTMRRSGPGRNRGFWIPQSACPVSGEGESTPMRHICVQVAYHVALLDATSGHRLMR
jgi:hypothetical protein